MKPNPLKLQIAGDQAEIYTPKVACKRTAVITKENGKRSVKTEPQQAKQSKKRGQNTAIDTEQAVKSTANHRFKTRPSLQSP